MLLLMLICSECALTGVDKELRVAGGELEQERCKERGRLRDLGSDRLVCGRERRGCAEGARGQVRRAKDEVMRCVCHSEC